MHRWSVPASWTPDRELDLVELTSRRVGRTSGCRRAGAMVLLDGGMSCEAIAKVLFVDDDTIRDRYRRCQEDEARRNDHLRPRRGVCRLPAAEREQLKAWIGRPLPCSRREIGEDGSRGSAALTTRPLRAVVFLLHPGWASGYRKPTAISASWIP